MNVRIRVGGDAGKTGTARFFSQHAFGVVWPMVAVTFMRRRRPVTVVTTLASVESLDGLRGVELARLVSARDACC